MIPSAAIDSDQSHGFIFKVCWNKIHEEQAQNEKQQRADATEKEEEEENVVRQTLLFFFFSSRLFVRSFAHFSLNNEDNKFERPSANLILSFFFLKLRW